MTCIGFLYSRTRVEEKLLLEEMERRSDVEVVRINDGDYYFDILQTPVDMEVVFERSISYSRGLYASHIFEAHGIPVTKRCGDKYVTSQILIRSGTPTSRVLMAFDAEAALDAIEALGYPCVLKPVVGSWGCLLARIDNREMAETIIEHKSSLGVKYQVFYAQEYINKPRPDIRAFVIGDEPIAAIYRASDNWITNTARGKNASNCALTVKPRQRLPFEAAQGVYKPLV